jgi:hypothetical protein
MKDQKEAVLALKKRRRQRNVKARVLNSVKSLGSKLHIKPKDMLTCLGCR